MNNNHGRRRTRRVRQQRKQQKTQIGRILLTVGLMALIAVVSIGGTIAWLTDSTDEIKNTFTPTDIDIELTEENEQDRTFEMVPGRTLTKDPKVTVKSGSEASYVFVKVDKSADLVIKEDDPETTENEKLVYTFDQFITYAIAEGWTETSEGSGVYYRLVDKTTADNHFAILDGNKVTVKDDVTKEMMNNVKEKNWPTLTFTAYAIQQEIIKDKGWTLDQIWTLAMTDGSITTPN